MAMTDGAVKTLKALKLDKADVGREAVERLLSRDGKHAWTSGQWMTEKRGGSDVGGGCDTYAVQIEGNKVKTSFLAILIAPCYSTDCMDTSGSVRP